jgi:hypothetical protein
MMVKIWLDWVGVSFWESRRDWYWLGSHYCLSILPIALHLMSKTCQSSRIMQKEVTYHILKYLTSLILPILCIAIASLAFCFLFFGTTPHKLDVRKFEVWIQYYIRRLDQDNNWNIYITHRVPKCMRVSCRTVSSTCLALRVRHWLQFDIFWNVVCCVSLPRLSEALLLWEALSTGSDIFRQRNAVELY